MSEQTQVGAEAPWTPKRLLEWSTQYFREKNIPNPRLDSEWLLSHVLGCRRIDLYIQFDRPLNQEELGAYREMVRARAGRQPVAYLVGEAEFWGLGLVIRPGCLIPRPDTETLVEKTLEAIARVRAACPEAETLQVLEMGTGSGAIPLAVCSEAKGICWVATERSPDALSVASENRQRHRELLSSRKNRFHLIQADGLSSIGVACRPHLIVSNPPYIPSDVIDTLEPEVARAEPRMALDGGPDGLEPHRSLLAAAERMLEPGGEVLLEIGFDQGAAASALVGEHPGLRLVAVHKDLTGNDRVLHTARVSPEGEAG